MSDNVKALGHTQYLQASDCIDCGHPQVQAFARQHALGNSDRERAVALYYAVRDGFRYDPYRIQLSVAGLCASSVLDKGYGWCVTKAVLLAAACRVVGIPTRLGYADVRNHLSTERLRNTLKTDVFFYHGYTDIWLDGEWRKATPAFNIELCDRFGIHPLDFDGHDDSIDRHASRIPGRRIQSHHRHDSRRCFHKNSLTPAPCNRDGADPVAWACVDHPSHPHDPRLPAA